MSVSKKHNSNYVIFVTYYYADGEDNICRIAAAVTDSFTGETVEIQEYWLDKYTLSTVTKKIDGLAKKYQATPMVFDEPFPLEKCPCCDGYVTACHPVDKGNGLAN